MKNFSKFLCESGWIFCFTANFLIITDALFVLNQIKLKEVGINL